MPDLVSSLTPDQPPHSDLPYPWDQINDTIKTYPVLGKYLKNFSFNYTPRGPGSHLETFPPGEAGTSGYPRPKALPNDTYGLDIYDTKITPQLIMGDAMIHGLRQLDPKVNDLYARFSNSILQDPRSYADLVRDYQWAKVNEGEKRDFETWANLSRIPELFGTPLYDTPVSVRGYSRKRFNREQQQIFHDTMQYIQSQ